MSANNTLIVLVDSLPLVGKGVLVTVVLALGSMAGALVLGLAVALGKMSAPRFLVRLFDLYVSFFRGTPLLIQL